MTDCTCQFDRERGAYTHVCTFHQAGIDRAADGALTLAGRPVTAGAVAHAVITNAAAQVKPRGTLADLEAATGPRRLEALEQEAVVKLTRAERRGRGQRTIGMFGIISGTTKRRPPR